MNNQMLYPPTIIYGCEIPDLRLRQHNGTQTYFCTKNANLCLTAEDFDLGAYEMGRFLGSLCRQHCAPLRKSDNHQPCPAFVSEWKVGTENKGLASVEMQPLPDWEKCKGVRKLLDTCQTKEERFFLKAYLDDKYSDEAAWRDGLIEQWNAHWHHVPEGWAEKSRRGRFEQMVWWTLRFPALIPQVWLNWLSNAPEAVMRHLDDNPSRVDFLVFWNGERHVIEIDGPSHYADFNGTGYKVDERAYARNLKIERSLRKDGWGVTRIARIEVRDAMDDTGFFGAMKLLEVLPFYPNQGYAEQLEPQHMGVPEIDRPLPTPVFAGGADDDIPF